ncbi:MAG: FHA domain-containing protein [Planctomycetaceae bacterium]
MPKLPQPGPPTAGDEYSGTLLETEEEIRQALLANAQGRERNTSARPAAAYRPTARPPVALLTVYDDGQNDGEQIRIRSPRFIIGRTRGDFSIPLDSRISSRHVEITYQRVGEMSRWLVTDLQSRHGLFVRVRRAAMADKAEILVGNGRYRFELPQRGSAKKGDRPQDERADSATEGWSEPGDSKIAPSLTELIGSRIGNRVILTQPEYWIGTDAACQIPRAQDPFCEPKHAHLYRARLGAWYADHNKSRNGLWLRVPQIPVDAAIQFQIGEQRFRLEVPDVGGGHARPSANQ